MTTCRICGMTYDPTYKEDKKAHADEHKKLASGIQPYKIREFYKSYGWAVAHNDGGVERLAHDPELGKLAVVYSWWNRALKSGIPQKDFDSYMSAHLAFVDAEVSKQNTAETRLAILKWEKFAG